MKHHLETLRHHHSIVQWGIIASAIAGAVWFLSPSVVAAALWLHISTIPAHPVAGSPTTLVVQTLRVTGGNCLNDPGVHITPVPAYTGIDGPKLKDMQLQADESRGSEVLTIHVERSVTDATQWDAQVVFPSPGTWTVRMTYPSFSSDVIVPAACSGAEAAVVVLSANVAKPIISMVVVAVAALTVLIVAVGTITITRTIRRRD